MCLNIWIDVFFLFLPEIRQEGMLCQKYHYISCHHQGNDNSFLFELTFKIVNGKISGIYKSEKKSTKSPLEASYAIYFPLNELNILSV